MENFSITKVYTRNLVTDSFQSIRNIFGLRLRGYEKMINNATKQLFEEAELKYLIKWYRLSINPLLKGSVMVTIYGEGTKKITPEDVIIGSSKMKQKRQWFKHPIFGGKRDE